VAPLFRVGKIGQAVVSVTVILYVQHAAIMGGAVISLRTVVRDAVAIGCECWVVCPNEKIASVYAEVGAHTLVGPVVGFNHNTSYWYRATLRDMARMLLLTTQILRGTAFLKNVLRRIKPDLVHLNSSTLIPYCIGLRGMNVPVLVHVRENVASGYYGLRRWLLARICDAFAIHIVFISERELQILKTNPTKSSVVYNYVDCDEFTAPPSWHSADKPGSWQLLSLGGISEIKGTHTLIEVASRLGPPFELTIIGSDDPREVKSTSAYQKRIAAMLDQHRAVNVHLVGATTDVRPYLAACNVLIFWSTVPHFARPVFEAWLFGKPAIVHQAVADGTNLSNETCLVVDDDSPDALMRAILEVKEHYPEHLRRAEQGRLIARQKFGRQNFTHLQRLYSAVTEKRVAVAGRVNA
jgi:glycosyltransferase involved in cell wall biosynthesis